MPKIFISYRKKDTGGHAGRLREELKRRYGGSSVFTDFESIDGGTRYRERIADTLSTSDVALVLVGENWIGPSHALPGGEARRRIDNEEDVLRREVAAALSDEDVMVVPILVEEAALPAADELPGELRALRDVHVCHLRNSEWKSDIARIERAIDAASQHRGPRRYLARARFAMAEHVTAVAATVAVVVVLALTLVLVTAPDSSGACENLDIPADVRGQLSKAARQREAAVSGSVYYGTCGSRSWAVAKFPDESDGVFVQDGFHWSRLGPVPTAKCEVPAELLDEWRLNDC